MEPETIENLIDFACENYGAFSLFSRSQVRVFFAVHQDTTAIARKKDGSIQAFLVWEDRGIDSVEILGVAAIKSGFDSIRLFKRTCKEFLPGKRIFWQKREKNAAGYNSCSDRSRHSCLSD